jgi:hypothetical protein
MKMLGSNNHVIKYEKAFYANKYDIQLIKYGFSLFEG